MLIIFSYANRISVSIRRYHKFINNLSIVIKPLDKPWLIYFTIHMVQHRPSPGLISFTQLKPQYLLSEVTQGPSRTTFSKTHTDWNFHVTDFEKKINGLKVSVKLWRKAAQWFLVPWPAGTISDPQLTANQEKRNHTVIINTMMLVTDTGPLVDSSSLALQFYSNVLIALHPFYTFSTYAMSDSKRIVEGLQCRTHTP